MFLHSPSNRSKIETQHPTISFSFGRSIAKQQSVNLFLDDKNVTDNCAILPGFLTYKPEQGLLPGRHTAKVIFQDTSGRNHTYRWEFYVKECCLIKFVSTTQQRL